jgi:hypothetical protein
MTTPEQQQAQIWMLIALLNGTRFAIAELEPHKMRHQQKMRFINLKDNVDNFLKNFQSVAPKKDNEAINSATFDNVAALAELTCLIAQMPPQLMDEFIERCKDAAMQTVEKMMQDS